MLITVYYFYTLLGWWRGFSSLFSSISWVSLYQKGKTSLDLNKARDDQVLRWQWHQLDHMQTLCTSLQADNHTNTSLFYKL